MVSQATNPYAALIGQYAQQYGVPADYALRIAHVENAPGNPNIVSPAGARGLMQIMPATAAGYGVQPQQLFDPNTNVQTGVHLLADLLHRYNGNQQLASIAYNAGPGWANRYQNGSIGLAGLPQETQNYLARLGITPMPVQTAQNQIPGAQVTAPVPAPPATTGFGWGGTLPGQNLTMAAAGSGFNGYGTTGAGSGYSSSGSAPGSAPSAGAHIGTASTGSPFGLDRALGLYLPGWANIG